MKINLYNGDLPDDIKISNSVAFDSETMGLNPKRDKLCLVQLSNGDEICHLVKIDLIKKKPRNLINVLKNLDKKVVVTFHGIDLQIDRKINYGYRLNKNFQNVFPLNHPDNRFIMEFSWGEKDYSYNFKQLPVKTLNNKKAYGEIINIASGVPRAIKDVINSADANTAINIEVEEDLVGGASYDKNNTPLTDDVLKKLYPLMQ